MYAVGIDIGSTVTKGVLMTDGIVTGTHRLPTGWSPRETGRRVLADLLARHQVCPGEVQQIVATGYGRQTMEEAHRKITEITCHARGAYHINAAVRTVLDIGGQDSKVVRLGDRGQVVDFIMNDKCAAGTGRFLQVMATQMEVDVSQLEELAAEAKPVQLNNMCTVFAESEVVGLLASGASKASIAAGLLTSVASKICTQAQRVGVVEDVFFSGGLAEIGYLKKVIQEKLGVPVHQSHLAQYTGAIGAALSGMASLEPAGKEQ
ncbi:CoA-substrate-specific enzyme activase, putative [Anoxynatronum buryatiense]|uniref:CoA-substrate-specific enzyme activase, putative n=2 Tax=Anoxynatronum buryatiense TaxID=489973 RepID=A0AA45WXT0_9CLOT|nr:CoA-substrate-specific enzyme activase, putative [Anoxynatronum buryatiense]